MALSVIAEKQRKILKKALYKFVFSPNEKNSFITQNFKKVPGIYVIRNKKNNLCYVGETKSIASRYSSTFGVYLRTKNTIQFSNGLLRKDISTFGLSNFEYYIMETFDKKKFSDDFDLKKQLKSKEIYYINKLKDALYNINIKILEPSESETNCKLMTAKDLIDLSEKTFSSPFDNFKIRLFLCGKSGVYAITNNKDNYFYIGSSNSTLAKGVNNFYYRLYNNLLGEKILNHAIKEAVSKIGRENFQVHILEFVDSGAWCEEKNTLLVRVREEYYLKNTVPYNRYNSESLVLFRSVRSRYSVSKVTRLKISKKKRGTKLSNKHKKRIAMGVQRKFQDKNHYKKFIDGRGKKAIVLNTRTGENLGMFNSIKQVFEKYGSSEVTYKRLTRSFLSKKDLYVESLGIFIKLVKPKNFLLESKRLRNETEQEWKRRNAEGTKGRPVEVRSYKTKKVRGSYNSIRDASKALGVPLFAIQKSLYEKVPVKLHDIVVVDKENLTD